MFSLYVCRDRGVLFIRNLLIGCSLIAFFIYSFPIRGIPYKGFCYKGMVVVIYVAFIIFFHGRPPYRADGL